jgi:hypothetical protein
MAIFAYVGPDVILPMASVVAAAVGVVMTVGRAPFRYAAKTWRYLFKKMRSRGRDGVTRNSERVS